MTAKDRRALANALIHQVDKLMLSISEKDEFHRNLWHLDLKEVDGQLYGFLNLKEIQQAIQDGLKGGE